MKITTLPRLVLTLAITTLTNPLIASQLNLQNSDDVEFANLENLLGAKQEVDAQLVANEDKIAFLNEIISRKNSCHVDAEDKDNNESSASLKANQIDCYKKILVDLADKFYPENHFKVSVKQLVPKLIENQFFVYSKIANCPVDKRECGQREEIDALDSTLEYVNQLIEYMALNVGESFPEFSPTDWLASWDAKQDDIS